MNNSITKLAALHAFGTTLYIVAVASFMFYVTPMIGAGKSVLIPIAMLLLFIFSAATTSLLVFGRPVLWYMDGKKKEAVSLLLSTLGFLLLITLVAFLALFLHFKR